MDDIISLLRTMKSLGLITVTNPARGTYVADQEMMSALGHTGAPGLTNGLSGDAFAALLGNAHERKNRGRNVPLLTTASWQRILDLTGDPQLASQTTVTCSLGGVELAKMPRVTGRLQWGTDGGTHEVLFDFVHGTLLSVPADGIRLDAIVDADPADVKEVLAGASVAYYPRGGLAPRRTLLTGVVGDDDNTTFDIPAFASRVAAGVTTADPTDLTGDAVAIEFLDSNGVSMMVVTGTVYQLAQSTVIPNGAAQVKVYNLLDGIEVTQSLIFDLSL